MTGITISLPAYEEMVRNAERIRIIERMLKEQGYVGATELKKILNIETKETK